MESIVSELFNDLFVVSNEDISSAKL